MKIGVVGLGRMGSVFASRLLDHGFSVGVWNRSAAKVAPLLPRGARGYSTPGALADESDVLLVSLADETAIEAVYSGPSGLLSSGLKGKIVVETSTVSPRFILKLEPLVRRAGGCLVDAPVLGTVGPAKEGRLVVVAGGKAEALEKANEVLSALSRRVVSTGPVGTGSAMKLVVNMVLAVYWQSLGDAIAMGEGNGLALDAMLDVIADSPIAIPAFVVKLPLLKGAAAKVDFDIAGVQKDLSAALATAQAAQVEALTAASALAEYKAAGLAGFAGDDVTAIVAFARRKNRRS